VTDVFAQIVDAARGESELWARAALPAGCGRLLAVFSALAPPPLALGLETVYEAYLVHYGRPRLFDPPMGGEQVLLGDYLYAHGLVRIAEAGGVAAVATMADLISQCAALRAAGEGGDGEAWVQAARALGGRPTGDDVARALRRHAELVAPVREHEQ
jgi:hypothetical protein